MLIEAATFPYMEERARRARADELTRAANGDRVDAVAVNALAARARKVDDAEYKQLMGLDETHGE